MFVVWRRIQWLIRWVVVREKLRVAVIRVALLASWLRAGKLGIRESRHLQQFFGAEALGDMGSKLFDCVLIAN
jgi:hypothetical protein